MSYTPGPHGQHQQPNQHHNHHQQHQQQYPGSPNRHGHAPNSHSYPHPHGQSQGYQHTPQQGQGMFPRGMVPVHTSHASPPGGSTSGGAPMPGLANESIALDELWIPEYEDAMRLDKWFAELDTDNTGHLSGAIAVGFLTRSNLPRPILREIWGLVDSQSRGFIDNQQFYKIMRLVAISCSPMYAGSKPTVDRYKSTMKSEISLPSMGSSGPTANKSTLTAQGGVGISSGGSVGSAPDSPARSVGSKPSGVGASSGSVGGGTSVSAQWTPSPAEIVILDKWFADLDKDHTGLISGAVAVGFLTRSTIHRQILRDIWALVDSQNRGSIDIQQFYRIMRLVAISCSPQHANMKPSWEAFHATSRVPFPLPPMGASPLANAPVGANPPPQPRQTPPVQQQQSQSFSHGDATTAPPEWIPSAPEIAVLDKWFTQLDADKTGHLSGAIAVGFLTRSGVPRQILRDIWALVDSQSRGSIDIQQFYRIMRLVAISYSPQHANMKPSWEAFHATSRMPYPFPPMDADTVVSPPVVSPPAMTAASPVPLEGVDNVDHEDAYAAAGTLSNSSSVSDLSALSTPVIATAPVMASAVSSDMLSASGSTVGGWAPSSQEAVLLNKWFADLDKDHTGLISGAVAVGFLTRSTIHRQILRDIWALVDSQNRGSIDIQQFYRIMRLVAISCSPQHANMKPSWEAFHATSRVPFPLPPMGEIDAHSVAEPPATPVEPLQPILLTRPVAVSEVEDLTGNETRVEEEVVEEVEAVEWVPSETGRRVLDKWFAELDTDNTGHLSGAIAVGFLTRSNLPRPILREIWGLVDSQSRGFIDIQQFYKIMRLVAISCSPMYAGSKPTVARYEATVSEEYCMPSMDVNSGVEQVVHQKRPHKSHSTPDFQDGGEEFGDFNTATATPPRSHAHVHVAHPNIKNLDDFMTDISSNPLAPKHASLSQLASDGSIIHQSSSTEQGYGGALFVDASSTGANDNRMSAFDALAELDLQANTEEWDDFADETTAAPVVPTDTSGDFGIEPVESVEEVVPESVEGVVLEVEEEGVGEGGVQEAVVSDPFGDMSFDAPLPPLPTSDPFTTTTSADITTTPTPTTATIEGRDREESFGEFGDFEGGEITATATSTAYTAEADLFSFDGDDVATPATATSIVMGGTEGLSEDPFASAYADSNLPTVNPVDQPATAPHMSDSGHENVDFGGARDKAFSVGSDDFGDFAQHNDETVSVAIDVDSTPVTATTSTSTANNVADGREKAISVGSDGFGDFADATDGAIDNAVDTNDCCNSRIQQADNGDGVSDIGGDEEQLDNTTTTATPPPNTSADVSTPAVQSINFDPFADLLDQVDAPLEPMMMMPGLMDSTGTGVGSGAGSSGDLTKKQPINISDLLSLSSTTTTTTTPILTTTPTIIDTTPARRSSENFAEYASAVHSDPIASSFVTSASAMSSEARQQLLSANECILPSPVGRAMNANELEIVAKSLYAQDELQMALLSCRQSIAVKTVKELSVRKMNAVENDDLELAIKLRDEINAAKEHISTIEEERVWLNKANELQVNPCVNNDVNSSLELIEMLSPAAASAAKNIFLADGFSIKAYFGVASEDSNNENIDSIDVSTATILLDAIRTSLAVRRSLRLMTALHTSHKQHAAYWKQLLLQVSKVIASTTDRIEAFQVLSKGDHDAIIAEGKMTMFLRGTIRIIEVGYWIVTSCLESVVEVQFARQVAEKCRALMKHAESVWGPIDFEYPLPSIEDLVISGAEGSVMPGAVHCNLSLRPVFVKSQSVGGREKRVCGAAYCDYNGASYMQAAISYWLNSISRSVPQSDGRFE